MSKFEICLIERYSEHLWSLSLKMEAQLYIDEILRFLFPHFSEKDYFAPEDIQAKMQLLLRDLKVILKSFKNENEFEFESAAVKFIEEIPKVYEELYEDAEAIFKGDPAAGSIDEVILAYPGFTAIAIYRFAHVLYKLKIPIFPRLLTEYAHQKTGVDIHPGATIGRFFCIDHGTGIVIGETSVIGDNVKIYQGVTLGALSVDKKYAQKKRHPTIENNVVIYAQAVILGGDTTIGQYSVIGGNSWLIASVPAYSLVFNKSEIGIRNIGREDYLDFSI